MKKSDVVVEKTAKAAVIEDLWLENLVSGDYDDVINLSVLLFKIKFVLPDLPYLVLKASNRVVYPKSPVSNRYDLVLHPNDSVTNHKFLVYDSNFSVHDRKRLLNNRIDTDIYSTFPV